MFERKKPPKTLNNRDIVSMNHGCRYSTIPIGSQLDGCSFLFCVSRSHLVRRQRVQQLLPPDSPPPECVTVQVWPGGGIAAWEVVRSPHKRTQNGAGKEGKLLNQD